MDAIVDAFNGFAGLKGKKDDDFVDRLSSRYTVVVLLVFAAIITFYQFGGSPIICWCPPHFTYSHMKFTMDYCWVKNTYYLPMHHEIPAEHEEEKREMLLYYQWIPFILLFQALLFYLPSVIWHGLNSRAGVDSDNILACANSLNKTEQAESREGILMLLTNQISRFLGTRKHEQLVAGSKLKQCLTSCLHCCGKRFDSYLTWLYILSKLFYLGNVLFQLHILNRLLSMSYNTYGFQVMKGMWSDHDWTESYDVAFPRVTMCDFDVRRLGNVHRYSVQCALPLNLWNEKIYVFLWFWLIFVCACTIISLVIWTIRVAFRGDRLRFIKNHLTSGGRLESARDRELAGDFLDNYLKHDGSFVMRLISHNTNNITTSDIICSVWDEWMSTVRKGANGRLVDDDDDDIPEKKPLEDNEV